MAISSLAISELWPGNLPIRLQNYNIHKLCTTAAIQIKGTAWWLYCVDLEYQPSQQIVQLHVDHAESANWAVRTWENISIGHVIYSVSSPPHQTPLCVIQFIT